MANPSYREQDLINAWQLIKQANTVTLLTHRNPDADGISASAALAHVLETMGKQVCAIYPSNPEQPLRLQPRVVTIKSHNHIPDLIIALDTANYERLYYPDAFKSIPLINIDHHISNTIQGTYNFNNPTASSTCEEVYTLLQHWCPDKIDRYVAECILFGILYDTQVFSTQSTTPKTLHLAAKLVDQGIQISPLCQELFATKTPAVLALWGTLLANLKTSVHQQAVCVTVTQQDLKRHALTEHALSGLSNFLWQMATNDVSILISETPDGSTKMSFRAKTVDVNAVAKRFGGGGHKYAAGAMVQRPPAVVEQEVLALF